MKREEIRNKYFKKNVFRRDFTKKSRHNYLIDYCKGKTILHIWPCDRPFTKEHLQEWNLLYEKIDKVAKKQIGIDLDKEWVAFLNSMNFTNSTIVHWDLNEFKKERLSDIFDVIIFWETLEHLMNLEIVLNGLKKLMDKDTELIITVPNASRLEVMYNNFYGISAEHPDHKVSFHYCTLKQLLEYNTFIVVNKKFSDYWYSGIWIGKQYQLLLSPIRKICSLFNIVLINLFPLFAQQLIIHAKKSTNS